MTNREIAPRRIQDELVDMTHLRLSQRNMAGKHHNNQGLIKQEKVLRLKGGRWTSMTFLMRSRLT